MVQSKEELMKIALEDPRQIIERGFWIVNKDKNMVPFIFNRMQNEFYNERTTHDDILKAGQLGFSSLILAIETVKFLFVPNSWAVSIGYEAQATARLFEKVDFYLTHMEPWLKPFLKLSKQTADTLENEIMNSRFYIGTQGARAFGRGDTIHYAHLTEVSRWNDAGRTATGILRAIPDSKTLGDVWAVKETTANGQGNYHHVEYKRAKAGRSKFMAHFFPWFKDEGYLFKGAQIPEVDLDEAEKRLMRRYPKDITIERLAWRRDKINTLQSENGRSPEEMFQQEFPSDDEEAFLFSGNPVFPQKSIKEMQDAAKQPIMKGNLVGSPPNQTVDETKQGSYHFWDFPEANGQYIIFADVGQYSDFCSATVVDKKTWKMVAKFHAVINSNQFGKELDMLGRMFNDALMAVESNNMGQSTIDKLVDLKYPNLYMRQRLDKKTKQTTDVPGWYTTEKTKSLIIGHMQEELRRRGDEGFIPDPETLTEYTTFIKFDDGSMGASEGNYDDQVMSTCGAFYILKLFPFRELNQQTKLQSANRAEKYKRFRTKVGLKKGKGFRRAL